MTTVLMVEDSPTISHLLAEALLKKGYEVLEANDGEEALRMADDQQPDVILLDVILPKLNGYQVCRQLKADHKTSVIPIIMITSKNQEKDREWGMKQGADVYLTKPINAEELITALEQVLASD